MNKNFEDWEKENFEDIMTLFEILEYHFKDKLSENFNSPSFFRRFSIFMYENSFKDTNFSLTNDDNPEYQRYKENFS